MTLTIKPDGAVEGKMEGLAFTGKVDKYGTLTAAGTWDGEKITIRTKMAPLAIYSSYPDKTDQPLEAYTENFERILMELKPLK